MINTSFKARIKVPHHVMMRPEMRKNSGNPVNHLSQRFHTRTKDSNLTMELTNYDEKTITLTLVDDNKKNLVTKKFQFDINNFITNVDTLVKYFRELEKQHKFNLLTPKYSKQIIELFKGHKVGGNAEEMRALIDEINKLKTST